LATGGKAESSGLLVPSSGLTVWLPRSALVDSDGWSSLADQLAKLPDQIEVEPLMDGALDGVGEISRVGTHLISPDIESSLSCLENALANFSDAHEDIYLFDVPLGAFAVPASRSNMTLAQISRPRIAMARAISNGNSRY
jgi:hypothetical protein